MLDNKSEPIGEWATMSDDRSQPISESHHAGRGMRSHYGGGEGQGKLPTGPFQYGRPPSNPGSSQGSGGSGTQESSGDNKQ